MDDVKKQDSDPTRPSKRINRANNDDTTRPVRPPGDPDNTILSANKQPSPQKPAPDLKKPQGGQSSPPQKPATPADIKKTQLGQPLSPQKPAPSDLKETQVGQPSPYHYQDKPKPAQTPPENIRSERQRTPVAPQQPYSPRQRYVPPSRRPDPYRTAVAATRPPALPQEEGPSRFTRAVAVLALLTAVVTVLILAGGLITYAWIASQLPPAEQLRSRSFQFATTQILDREGNLLWEIIDPTGGRRTTVTLAQISPDLINATIATEDRFFYLNVGVDPIAIGRALYYNFSEGEIVSGASTITQQLARNVLLTPEERTEQSVTRKIREAVLAVEINRRYTKDQILEIYLINLY
jgi:hypothetical protein